MSSVFSVKIRKELKEKMEKYKDKVDWASEVRSFIEAKINDIEAEENIKKVLEKLSKMPHESPKGSAVLSIRENRDSN